MNAAPEAVVVHCDGGARGNPGPAGIGATIAIPRGETIEEISEPIGVATNNVAEYAAVLEALRRARALGARRVDLRTDSKLLVEQLNGNYRVKSPGLRRLYEEVRAEVRALEEVRFTHVPRERNRRADRLVNDAIDAWLAEHPDAAPPERARQEELFE